MPFSLRELADRLGLELRGDPGCVVNSVAGLAEAQPGQLSFLSSRAYRSYLATTRASAVILDAVNQPLYTGNTLVTANPYAAYAQAASLLHPEPPWDPGIHPSASIGDACDIHPSVAIGPYCVLEECVRIGPGVRIGAGSFVGRGTSIGRGSRVYPRVSIYHGTRVGERTIIHSGAVIGSDGFGFAQAGAAWIKIPQIGAVRIGNDVEIGANTTIDRGALGDTVVEDGVKLDNQVQVAHNVHIGAYTAIAGCVGIAGSAKIGRYCTIAGGVGIVGHLEIADRVHVTGMSMVTKSITEPGVYSSGTPLQRNRLWHRNFVRFKQLDELASRVAALEKRQNGSSNDPID